MKILYFAWVRQKTGVSEETCELHEKVETVRALAEHLRRRSPGHADAFADLARLRAAVNQEHVSFDTILKSEDEVAFFPPVTGG